MYVYNVTLEKYYLEVFAKVKMSEKIHPKKTIAEENISVNADDLKISCF